MRDKEENKMKKWIKIGKAVNLNRLVYWGINNGDDNNRGYLYLSDGSSASEAGPFASLEEGIEAACRIWADDNFCLDSAAEDRYMNGGK
jgi:hypothetical protein